MSFSRPFGYRLLRTRPAPAPTPALDHAQRAVVDHPGGPLLVLAGPGTGKTTTLVEAVVARVRRGVRPDRVLVLTFSRKAADELRERVAAGLGGALAQPSAWTFHAWCYAFVNAHARTGQHPPPRLLSGPARLVRIRDLLEGSALGEGRVRWPDPLRPALRTRGFAGELADLLDRARERGVDPGGLRALAAAGGRADWAVAADFYEEYVAVLGSRGEMDYAELVRTALALLEDDADVLQQVRTRYAAVFVDEYQDTDPAQEHLLRLLAGGGRDLVVVGDPDQSIYAFRGADVSCLLGFPDRFRTGTGQPAPVLALSTGRRFGTRLRDASRSVAERIPTPGLPLTARAAHRDLRPAPGAGEGQVDVQLFASGADEANAVADLLRREHLERGTPWREMAVLTRSAPRTVPILRRALVGAGVPVAVAADEVPVAEEPAVQPLLLALRAAAHPDELSTDDARLLLSSPLGRAGAGELRRLGRALRAAERAAGVDVPRPSAELLREALVRPHDMRVHGPIAAPVRRVADLLARARAALAAGAGVEYALWAIWEGSGWPQRLAAASFAGGAEGRAADRDLDAVVALFDAVAELTERHPGAGLATLLAELQAQEIPPQRRVEGRLAADGVRLLTAHRSKGLEWEVAVVSGVQEGVWPDLRRRGSLLEADRIGPHGPVEPPGVATLLTEERRLFYVAVTRARRRLVVTAVAGQDEAAERPSRFVAELGVPLPEPSAGRSEPLTLPSLVGRLRAALTDPGTEEPLRAVAAAQLARLAAADPHGRPVVPTAHPDRWWGLAEWTRGVEPVRRAPEPVALSASSVAAFDRCPLAWFLDHEARGAGAATGAQGFGIVVHALAYQICIGELPADVEAVTARVDEVWAGLGFEAPWERERERAAARAALHRLITWEASHGRAHVASEASFDVTLEPADGPRVRLRGSVDRLDRDGAGRVHIVDYKTTASSPTQARVDSDPQLAVYQVVAAAGGFADVLGADDVPVGGAELVQLRDGLANGQPRVQRQPPLDADAAGRTWAHELVERTAAALLAERFPARPNDGCDRCAFARCCPASDTGGQVVP